MKKYIFSFIFLIWYSATSAQETDCKTRYFVSYYGETVTHPGLNLGIEITPYKSDMYQIVFSANMGAYVHNRNNTSFFVRSQWGQRATFKSGIFIDHFLGFGYLHQFTHGGDVYEVLPNGEIVENSTKGNPKFMPSIALGVGYDLSKKHGHSIAFFLRPELFWKAPFNGYYLTHFAINAGIMLNL